MNIAIQFLIPDVYGTQNMEELDGLSVQLIETGETSMAHQDVRGTVRASRRRAEARGHLPRQRSDHEPEQDTATGGQGVGLGVEGQGGARSH